MKEESADLNLLHTFLAVCRVADNRVLHGKEVCADLVRAAGFNSDIQECGKAETFDDVKMRNSLTAFLRNRTGRHTAAAD